MNIQSIIALLANGIFVLYLCTRIPKFRQIAGQYNFVWKIICYVLVMQVLYAYPVHHSLTIVEVMRGAFGDLSITNICVFGVILIYENNDGHNQQILNIPFSVLVVILGSILYFSTLGVIPYDVYALGYYPNVYVLAGVIMLEVFLWYFNRTCAWIWIIALFAFYFKLQDSINLWDYLFDPVLWMISLLHMLNYIYNPKLL